MIGLSRFKTLLILSCVVLISACKSDKKIDSKHISSDSLLLPLSTALRALDEDELKGYKNYDYYLFYLEHRPWRMSYALSIRLKDSVLYSYTKYLDNIVSTDYPPLHYLANKDSIFFYTAYQEHPLGLLDTLNKYTRACNFYDIKSDTTSFRDGGHDSKWLVICSKSKSHSIFNWDAKTLVEKTLIRYLQDSLMRLSPLMEKSLYRESGPLENHIPKF